MSGVDFFLEGTELAARERRTPHLAIKPSAVLPLLRENLGELPSRDVLKHLVNLSLAIQRAGVLPPRETGLIAHQFIKSCIREILQLRETNPEKIDRRISEITYGYTVLVAFPSNLLKLEEKSLQPPFKERFMKINILGKKVPELRPQVAKKFADFQGRIHAETWDIWREILGDVTAFALLDSAGFKPEPSPTKQNFCTIETGSQRRIPIQVKTDLYSPYVWFSVEGNQDALQPSLLLTINIERLTPEREIFIQLLSKNPQNEARSIVDDFKENVILSLREK